MMHIYIYIYMFDALYRAELSVLSVAKQLQTYILLILILRQYNITSYLIPLVLYKTSARVR